MLGNVPSASVPCGSDFGWSCPFNALRPSGAFKDCCDGCQRLDLASDLYKDRHGVRPRHLTPVQLLEWLDRQS